MVLDGALATAGDDQDLGDAGLDGLFHNILDHRFVHDGEHFFGDGLGGRKHTGAQAGCRDNCLADLHGYILLK